MTKRHWIDSYGSIPSDIDPDGFHSLNVMLNEAMTGFADKPAFRSGDRTLSYADVDLLSASLAAYLQKAAGVRKGDRVAVMLPNVVEFPVTFIAATKIGAIQVNVNPLYTAPELEHQLNDAGVDVIVTCSESMRTLADVIDRTRIHTVISVMPDEPGEASDPCAGHPALRGKVITFMTALAEGKQRVYEPVWPNGDDLLLLQYTGGTTGLSKGAALSHRNLVANILQFRAFLPDAQRPGVEVVVTALPMYHVFAFMANFLSYFVIGAENWLVANPRKIDTLIDILEAARPTVFFGVNTLYAGLVNHPRLKEVDWSRLRLSGGGGSAMFEAVSAQWKKATGNFIREGYGLSETSPIVSFNPQSINDFGGTAGLPVPSTDVMLLDENGCEAGIGTAGEICVRGPQVMRGYWNAPEANKQAFTPDGYFRTGDIGVFNEKGFLAIVDRKKDMVIVSGFNVYPNEVEAVVTALPGVRECACVGVPDEKTGEAVKLFVVQAKEEGVDEETLIAHCRSRLAAYKVPKIIRFVDELPKTAVGKILRRAMHEVS
ncbi:AMP-binding protein [Paraburkholderia sp.]|uniref:AMP-binding protein n=1 Tax=Paraburkholderia sp. TaxID=1926495 RepID=UPI0025D838B1|nr:AMP-binding protein [Paraburkholderia sp.]